MSEHKQLTRRSFLKVATGSSAALLLALPVATAGCNTAGPAFPSKTIELFVVFPPGGSSDVLMRSLAEAATPIFGQQVVVVNKAGGNGIIGTGEGARAKPDGYTVTLMQAGPGATQPHVDKVDYKIEDFAPLMLVFKNPLFLFAGLHTPWTNAKEFAEDAKKRPGQINFGASPVGGVPHLVMEFFGTKAGFKVNTVPFQGAAPALTALIGGHVDCNTAHPPDAVAQKGKLKILGVFEPERLKEFPEVPTMREQGYDAVGYVWGGLVVPKDTPKDIQTKLHDGFKKALESQLVKDAWGKLLLPPSYAPPDEFLKLWKEDYDRFGVIIGDLKKSGRL